MRGEFEVRVGLCEGRVKLGIKPCCEGDLPPRAYPIRSIEPFDQLGHLLNSDLQRARRIDLGIAHSDEILACVAMERRPAPVTPPIPGVVVGDLSPERNKASYRPHTRPASSATCGCVRQW